MILLVDKFSLADDFVIFRVDKFSQTDDFVILGWTNFR